MQQSTPLTLIGAARKKKGNPFFDAVSRALKSSPSPSDHARLVAVEQLAARFAQMESTRLPRQLGRRTFPSRPRSRIYRKKQSIVKRVASTLRRRRSQLHFVYQNALIEMAESKLNLPHEGQPGLIYAVSELPTGHSRQSLVDVFDDVVATMSASTTKSTGQRSWVTCRTSHDTRSDHSMDLLTGDYNGPEDFDHFLTWQPLRPRPTQQSSKADGVSHELTELTWSPPRTPSKASNVFLIDLDTPPSIKPPTPPNGQSSYIDELFFGGLSEALATLPLLPSQSLANLDAELFPQPLDFKDSPYPVLGSLATSTHAPPRKTLQKRAVHGNLKLDTQHPALLQGTPLSRAIKTPNPTHPERLIPRKPVPWTTSIHQQWLTPAKPPAYRPYGASKPSPQLPQLLTPATNSLLDEMRSAIDRVMESFNPTATSKEPPPATSLSTPTRRGHRIPIPPRTTSLSATTTTTTPNPGPRTPCTTGVHSSSSFRTRLGTSTLNALLRASDAASPSSSPFSSPTQSSPAEPYGWRRWVDRMGDPDSETEEREYSRRWREKKRRGRRRRGDGGDGSVVE